jgi:hypothetical protein
MVKDAHPRKIIVSSNFQLIREMRRETKRKATMVVVRTISTIFSLYI